MRLLNLLLMIIIAWNFIYPADAPKWRVELDESIKNYEFINDGKYLFFTNGEYAWCYDVQTGSKIWSMEVDDFDKEGISTLVGEKYLVNSDDLIQCFNALNGEKLWEKEYDDISQSDYTSFEFIKNTAVLRFGEDHLGIDLSNGNELWRTKIDYWSKLAEKGTFNYSVLSQQNKLLVLEDDEKASLFDIQTGGKIFEGNDYDVNMELVENGNLWMYKSPGQKYIVVVLEKGAAVIDVVNNKEIMRKEFSIDGEMNVIIPTKSGCAVLGEEKIVHFNFDKQRTDELNFPVEDFRTLQTYDIGGKDILVISLEDQLAGIDLAEGKILWQTKEDDPEFEGYAHKYVSTEGNNIILTYNRAKLVSTESGTYVYLISIDALTGKLNYKVPVLLSQTTLTGFQRGLAKTLSGAFAAFVGAASMGSAPTGDAMNMVNNLMGYQNIGFDYEVFEHNAKIIIAERTTVNMWDPSTRDGAGEGFVAVDPKMGNILYKEYFEIAEGMDQNQFIALASMLIDNNIIYAPGEDKLAAFDLANGKKLWEINETGLITDLSIINGVLYIKHGKQEYAVTLNENDVKVNETWDEDPFGFKAIDPASGNVLWSVKTETDPGLVTPQFSIQNYYNPADNRLYYADEQNVYALTLGKDGGKFGWQFNFDGNNIGEMEYAKTFAVKETWIGSQVRTTTTSTSLGGGWVLNSTTTSGGLNDEKTAAYIEDALDADVFTTYTSWGNIWGVTAKRCLRVLYNGRNILVFGPEAITLLNASDGKPVWIKEWDYDQSDVQFIPQIVGDKFIYCMDENLVLRNLSDGEIIWQSEEPKKTKFFHSPDGKFFFSINDEIISGYEIIK